MDCDTYFTVSGFEDGGQIVIDRRHQNDPYHLPEAICCEKCLASLEQAVKEAKKQLKKFKQ